MRVWTVHTPPEARRLARAARASTPSVEARLRLPVLVPEGFAWLAFLFGLPWLLWHRLWLESAIYIGGLAVLALLLPATALVPASLALHVLLGAHARDLRRMALARRGYAEAHVVVAGDADRALARVLEARPELAHMPVPEVARAGVQPA
jgi:hypothetical protein